MSVGADDWRPEDVLARQLELNEATWARLREHGVDEETELRLDFFYVAPNEDAANELAGYLRRETDYEVSVEDATVTGTTQPTTVSASVLDEWATWMVTAGYQYGRCEFDGWGAEVP